jgi:hypothetical protein
VPCTISGFIIKPHRTQQRKRKQRIDKEKVSVHAVIMCAQHKLPPPLFFSARPASPACGYGYQDRRRRYGRELPSPPSSHPYPIFDNCEAQRWISVTPSVTRSWVEKLISDSDGDCFLLWPIFDRTPEPNNNLLHILKTLSWQCHFIIHLSKLINHVH